MLTLILVLLILLVLAEGWTLLLRCRRGHPGWKLLRQYRYAHRGYHDKPHIPENSMAAFHRAIENGFGAELDVHLLKDGHLAVIHDASLKRTAGADVLVEDLTSEELKAYRLEGTDERIPLLDEVLALFEGKTPLVVELKPERGNHAELAAATCALLDRYRVDYCIESFDPRCLIWPALLAVPAPRGDGGARKAHHVAARQPHDEHRRAAGLYRLPVPGSEKPRAGMVPQIL